MRPFELAAGSNNRTPPNPNLSQPQLPLSSAQPTAEPQQLPAPSSSHINLSHSQPVPLHAPLPRPLAPRHQTLHSSPHSSPQPESLSHPQSQHQPDDHTPFHALPQNRSPSPSTTAAAMSLGALAAAASLAAAAVPSNPTRSGSYALTHMPQHNVNTYPHPAPKQEQAPMTVPSPAKAEPTVVTNTVTQSLPNYPVNQHQPEPPLPALKPINAPPMPHPKVNAKPVAPAPSNAMHPSQQQMSNTRPNGKPKQRRYRATPEQLGQLIALFEINPSPASAELQELAAKITMPTQSVVLWFKNRRARVPHKKAEKALNAKRRENGELSVTGGVSKSSKNSHNSKKAALTSKKDDTDTTARKSPSSSEKAAAASMAEMAMALASGGLSNPSQSRPTARNVTKQDTPQPAPRPQSFPVRTPNRSPPPVYRAKVESVVPYDSNLVQRLGAHATQGAEFVQASQSTPRRPRAVPPTPRLKSQREYHVGDSVEVLENGKGICRSWYSGSIVGRCGPRELSLGASAAATSGLGNAVGREVGGDRADSKSEETGDSGDGGDSPRTVRSPVASPTPPIAKVWYLVEYEHRFEEGDEKKRLREEVLASRLRPAAPFSVDEGYEEWKPEIGEPVEVLRDGAWFVAVVQTFAVRKGYMVSFESGDVAWVRRPRLRPHQIWKGGRNWVTKMKPPLPVVRKSVGLSVTHPPGGKRKRASGETGKERETRGRSKRSKSMNLDGSGPDGLPEGWRVDQVRGAGVQKHMVVYVAPDGHRLRSLKEAQRYVKMMGPV